jgi:hypothetical protein
MKRVSFLLAALLLCALTGPAQRVTRPTDPGVSVVAFDLTWEAITPARYFITVDSSGNAKYISCEKLQLAQQSSNGSVGEAMTEPEPDFELSFTMSPANRDKIFHLAKDANYFDGVFDYTAHRIANTGKKVLTYADSGRIFQTIYNWSENKSIDQLTKLFQGISYTIEHGRRLQFLRRFDKLGLEKELKGMEEAAQSGYMAEIQIIAPTLENIANDPAILHIARERARRLLALNAS